MTGIVISIFLGALISIAVIALVVLLGAWTYRDAQNKGMNGILWTAVVLLVPSCIGLIIYLIIRMDNQKVICSNCNRSVNGKDKFCSNCGVELVPVVDASEDAEVFKKSQRKLLIGFFSTLAAIVIMSIFIVAFTITGTLKLVGNAVEWVSELDTSDWIDTMEDALGDIDTLFDEDEIHVSIVDNKVTITDRDGNRLVHIDGDKSVDVNLKEIKELLDEHGIEYDEDIDEKELEEEIRQEIEKAIKDAIKDNHKKEHVDDHEEEHN